MNGVPNWLSVGQVVNVPRAVVVETTNDFRVETTSRHDQKDLVPCPARIKLQGTSLANRLTNLRRIASHLQMLGKKILGSQG